MTKTINLFTALVLTAGALFASATGCELIAKVDRGKVPPGTGGGNSSSSSAPPMCTTAGAMSCTGATDCPAPAAACMTATCEAGCCGTTTATADTACTEGGGKVCDGTGKCVACIMGSDCAAQQTACITNTCAANTCGMMNAASGATCNDNAGKLCDGAGKCVACLAPTDCAAQTTLCKTNTCDGTAHTCGTNNAAKGTTCSDNSGVVCDGNGTCVSAHCTDGVKDDDETDVDCGGSCGGCADGLKCMTGTDCVDKICDGTAKTCSAPTCTDSVQNGDETDVDCGGSCDSQGKKCADQKHCSVNGDCTNGFCFGSGPGTCVSCGDGMKDGNETDVDCGGPQCDPQGKTCPAADGCKTAGDCTSPAPCSGTTYTPASTCNGSDKCVGGTPQSCMSPTGLCSATSGCVQCNMPSDCGAPSCSAGILTPQPACTTNACVAGTPAACNGGFVCASASSCKTVCAGDGDCEGSGVFCKLPGGTCVTDETAGTACTGNDQCTSSRCGTTGTGHCCNTACSGGTCGATDCDALGACAFASTSTSCTASSCTGFSLTTFTTCNGSGACTGTSTTMNCQNSLICGSATACLTGCGADTAAGDANCTPTSVTGGAGDFWCDGTGSGPNQGVCQPTLGTSGTCIRDSQCKNGACGSGGTAGQCP